MLAALALVAALTFRDYGLGWDDFTHSQYGDLLLKLYGSGFTDTRALSFVNLYKYGGGFDMAAALADKVLPFGLFETRRLVGAVVGIIGLFATWRLGRRLGGPIAGTGGAHLARRLPALLRPHVHEPEGRALRNRDGGVAARDRARASTNIRKPACAARRAVRRRHWGLPSARASWRGVAAPYGVLALAADCCRRGARARLKAGRCNGSDNSSAPSCRRWCSAI